MIRRESVLAQYKGPNRLETRIRFHRDCSRAPHPFPEWILDQIPLEGHEHILDAGCGTGVFLLPLAERLKGKSGKITGLDLSSGILKELKERAQGYDNVSLVQGDLQEKLPFPDETFDLVMAHFVLYHLEHIPHAIRELKRVLKPGGTLLLSTGSHKNLFELEQIHTECKQILGFPPEAVQNRNDYIRFSVENGASFIRPHFSWFELRTLCDQIVVRSSEALMEYYASGMMERGYEEGTELRTQIPDSLIEELYHAVRKKVDRIIEREGEFRMQKQTGCFIAVKEETDPS
ncbi:class I SAM-dependent methyltransferase [Staphylospora marina]|uniref:class I SAM-dependent methyltransferase n=1 Tax=Staphylospora marina TaxID=2490858 RepID=UPI0013DE128D|nr:class I SAM-dependent methyltransferase [Staphylospora marina]